MSAPIATAHRVTMDAARRMFLAGAGIVVATTDVGATYDVHATTTVNTLSDHMSWSDLSELVTMWRNRYPGQTFYAIGAGR